MLKTWTNKNRGAFWSTLSFFIFFSGLLLCNPHPSVSKPDIGEKIQLQPSNLSTPGKEVIKSEPQDSGQPNLTQDKKDTESQDKGITKLTLDQLVDQPITIKAPFVSSRKKSPPAYIETKSTVYSPAEKSFKVKLDISEQILSLSRPRYPSSNENKVYSKLSELLSDYYQYQFVSASLIAFKAKIFDDGLYAAVEYVVDQGLGKFPSKKRFLKELYQALNKDNLKPLQVKTLALIGAALQLGGENFKMSEFVDKEVRPLKEKFRADSLRSKPIGFYTWNDKLFQIFQQDRLLQTELMPKENLFISQGLVQKEILFKAYQSFNDLNRRLTNPLSWYDLSRVVSWLKEDKPPKIGKDDKYSLFPPSMAVETELAKKLFGNSPIPDWFNLAHEVIKRIRDGRIDLKPEKGAGWYHHQIYALEPLVIPERMPESEFVTYDREYRKILLELFKSLFALTRETHIKQLEIPRLGAGSGIHRRTRVKLKIYPTLDQEPLATYYLRRAQSYRFVRNLLETTIGKAGLNQICRKTEKGNAAIPLATELRQIEGLFYGAYLATCSNLGMVPEKEADLGLGKGPVADYQLFKTWTLTIKQDPDLTRDVRMMVPLFFDLLRKKTKVWIVYGFGLNSINVAFQKTPRVVEITDASGSKQNLDNYEISFNSDGKSIIKILSEEVYVSKILNRTEFQKHCDTYKTRQAIIKNLE